jgi:chorismate synthase
MVQNFMSSAEPLSRVVHHKPTKSLSQAVGTLANQNSKEEDCFSPIRHENSISRDCIQAVVAVREAIQVPIFNCIEYYEGDNSSIPRYNERIEKQH